MGRKEKTDKPPKEKRKPPGWWAAMEPAQRAAILRGSLWAVLVAVAGCGLIFGFRYMEGEVQARQDAAPMGVQVRLVNWPYWAPASLLTSVSQDLTPPTMRFTERALPDEVYRLAKAHPWLKPDGIDIRKVESGSAEYGIVQVRAQFRQPVACVKAPGEDAYEYVDAECVRVPADQVPKWIAPLPPTANGGKGGQAFFASADDVPPSMKATPIHYIRIEGVQAPVPDEGQKWEGRDLADGVRLVALAYQYKFFAQVAGIDVANHDGRLDKNRPTFVMTAATPDGRKTEVLLNRFRRPEGDWVVPPEQALRTLNDDYYSRAGTLAGIDLRIDARGETLTSVAN